MRYVCFGAWREFITGDSFQLFSWSITGEKLLATGLNYAYVFTTLAETYEVFEIVPAAIAIAAS